MNKAKLKTILPRASESFLALNAGRVSSGAEPESSSGNESLGTDKGKEKNPTLRRVSITSYRVRLLDIDNLMGKWHLDSLRYAGVIKDDSVKHITYQIQQKKVAHKTQERTLISIE